MNASPAGARAVDRPPIRVVIADDAYLLRVALRHLIDGVDGVVIVGECDARSVPRVVDEQRAEVLITDIRMPIAWTLFFAIWYMLGIPLGPGWPVHLG
jgi:DNA-binding NarL/FixJ family response regulator